MSTQRFTPEFKEEAVKQVTELGYSVAEVSARLGVSSHSLYKWVKAISSDNSERQAAELIEARSEILRLKAQLRRTEEERDILKKPRGTLPGSPGKVPLHERASTHLAADDHVPFTASCQCRLLSMAASPRV